MLWIGIALVACALVLNVVSMRLRRRGAASAAPSAADASSTDQAARSDIDGLVADGQQIAAIKRLREAVPGLGLAEAKARIDAWNPAAPPVPQAASVEAIDAHSLAEIDALIAEDQPIRAIKLVRERTGWGLADAKHWVDARARR